MESKNIKTLSKYIHAYNNVALTRKTDKASNLIVKENFLNIFVSQGKCDKGGLGKNSPKN